MKATEQDFSVVLRIAMLKVSPSESVDEILECDHLWETY